MIVPNYIMITLVPTTQLDKQFTIFQWYFHFILFLFMKK